MAKKVETEEERLRRIIAVGEYVSENGTSSRKTAEYFSKNFFPISNNTVSEYCKLYIRLYPHKSAALVEAIKNNKEKTIEDEDVLKRVLYNASLVTEEGYTIEEISNMTGVSYWTVYRDLTDRLEKADPELFEGVKNIFSKNRNNNIKK